MRVTVNYDFSIRPECILPESPSNFPKGMPLAWDNSPIRQGSKIQTGCWLPVAISFGPWLVAGFCAQKAKSVHSVWGFDGS